MPIVRAALTATTAVVLTASCTSPDTSLESPRGTTQVTSPGTAVATPSASTSTARTPLGEFPQFRADALPPALAAALQDTLESAFAFPTLRGATAAVIVGGEGSWTGAVGIDPQGEALTVDSKLSISDAGKTVTAAQVLRLVDEGRLGLDDPAKEHFPPEIAAFNANGARVRDLLGMRSGLRDPEDYLDIVARRLPTADLVELMEEPAGPPGAETHYANMNYVLLGEIIEEIGGGLLEDVIREGVLSPDYLQGFEYQVDSALAAEGWDMYADIATFARWGYELYGGFVVSESSLQAMTDFQGESYGLGTLDFSGGGDTLGSVGHGGMGESAAAILGVYPAVGVVVAVQANTDHLDDIHQLVDDLLVTAQL